MTDKNPVSALQRKLASPGGETLAKGWSILRALRVATARAAAEEFGLSLSVIGATQAWRDHGDLAPHLDDARLLILLDGPESATGALALDRAVVGALIQHQTMGKVLGNSSGTRPYTSTDAALAAPLVDAMLTSAQKLCDQSQDRDCLAGFRFGARAETQQALLLALDGDQYRAFDLTLDIDRGKVQGVLSLVVPDRSQPENSAYTGDGAMGHSAIFGMVRAELMASIGRIQLSLSTLTKVQVGDVLPLQGQNLRGVEFISIMGERVASGRLGQVRGLRAVRLSDGVAPDSAAGSFADRANVCNPAPLANNGRPSSDTARLESGGSCNTPQEMAPEDQTAVQAAEEITQRSNLVAEDAAEPEAEEQ
ncbi:FliM/FliN family flagellar motor C-terminal domain-containing protein [Pontibaca salina]|uniref:FliM/FliN family flagellar motor switch protein n=1 Tax=Pontibaca salina TaxID=2795731 RepID=A0A934HKQ3_9RHOB|nr:FliM/FliN family flagellar motor C-terminal domain-containing protein [Pontibaca salina]MBI6628636.1 FliM/FliN family flagellar motor switch protein [Pontibaca salina]